MHKTYPNLISHFSPEVKGKKWSLCFIKFYIPLRSVVHKSVGLSQIKEQILILVRYLQVELFRSHQHPKYTQLSGLSTAKKQIRLFDQLFSGKICGFKFEKIVILFLGSCKKKPLQKKIGPNIVSARMEIHALEIFHRPFKLEWRLCLRNKIGFKSQRTLVT